MQHIIPEISNIIDHYLLQDKTLIVAEYHKYFYYYEPFDLYTIRYTNAGLASRLLKQHNGEPILLYSGFILPSCFLFFFKSNIDVQMPRLIRS